MNTNNENKQPAIVFFCAALVFFLAFIGFFVWHTVRMRSHELNYVQIKGTVVDIEARNSHSTDMHAQRIYYYLVISYEFDGTDYTFTDIKGHKSYNEDWIGKYTKVYVNPQNPAQAEMVSSSDFVSILCAVFFAFFCVCYAVGVCGFLTLVGSSFMKRLLLVWGVELLIGVASLLLFWLGLPHSGFGEVFTRIEGAIGITVICGLALIATFIDGIVSYVNNR